MKLASIDQVKRLMEPGAPKRRDADELGENLYYCWLSMVVDYLEKRKAEEVALYERDKLRRYKRFEYYANEAAGDKQWASAINAEYRRGLLGGFYVERKEVVTASLDNMSRKELKEKLEKYKQENQLIQDAEWKEIENNSEEK